MEVQEEEDGSSSALMTLDDNNILITLAVSLDQEIAIRTFFQVNDWPLIEGGNKTCICNYFLFHFSHFCWNVCSTYNIIESSY